MLKEQRNSKKKGDVGLGAAIAYFTRMGYCVCLPLTDSQEYDLVVDIDGNLNKVQVKTTAYKTKHGIYSVGLRTLGGNQSFHTVKNFNKDLIDLLFILCETGDSYLIPATEITCINTINLGKDYYKYKLVA
jgi:hypothetical protein